ncbi:hypothetical protein JOQ06_017154 [Pogonophryne albipinna]|uniref:C-type lectin domain-containing protein n=1 Tax=Pogonophryne albipinna TaxID=1090488 RepID=A0AAD6B3L7_9TELE|nr:hypothetical protein JOQ06_017154 [Pogonophryne albipinna]
MDFMKLFGTVIAVFFYPGSSSKINGQRICRRGTERPCYKVSYIQESRRRLTFEDARQACRSDGGDLLSIETESEQRLMERFIQQLQAGDGDFWIGLRRSPQRYRPGSTSPGCPSQYYWLDGSKAKFRNWHWDEPSCEKVQVFTEEGDKAHAVPSLRPNVSSTTERDEKIKIGLPESSVSFSENTLYVSYILRNTKTDGYPSRSKPWKTTTASPYAVQGPYAFSDITKLPHTALDSSMPADIMKKYPCAPSQESQCDDYENVSCVVKESGFVNNDIYETCRGQSRHAGWVENEIYG